MKPTRLTRQPYTRTGERLVRNGFEQARRTLRASPMSAPASEPTPADWLLLSRIQEWLEYAFTTRDWPKAKREIQVLKRRAQIRIIKTE